MITSHQCSIKIIYTPILSRSDTSTRGLTEDTTQNPFNTEQTTAAAAVDQTTTGQSIDVSLTTLPRFATSQISTSQLIDAITPLNEYVGSTAFQVNQQANWQANNTQNNYNIAQGRELFLLSL